VGSSFSLALGAKVRRELPLRNAGEDDESKLFQGEFRFLVWCAWRLESEAAPIASSDQEPETIARALEVLRGKALIEASVSQSARMGSSLALFRRHSVIRVL
jgi:hypothetical protein